MAHPSSMLTIIKAPPPGHALILFDGVCNLCNGAVNFVIDHDREGVFKFGALQAEAAQPVLARLGLAPDKLDSVMLVEGDRYYEKSTAALRIARRLSGAWPLLYAFVVVPRPVRDAVYDWVAANRYRWFGRRESCRLPTPALQAQFL